MWMQRQCYWHSISKMQKSVDEKLMKHETTMKLQSSIFSFRLCLTVFCIHMFLAQCNLNVNISTHLPEMATAFEQYLSIKINIIIRKSLFKYIFGRWNLVSIVESIFHNIPSNGIFNKMLRSVQFTKWKMQFDDWFCCLPNHLKFIDQINTGLWTEVPSLFLGHIHNVGGLYVKIHKNSQFFWLWSVNIKVILAVNRNRIMGRKQTFS